MTDEEKPATPPRTLVYCPDCRGTGTLPQARQYVGADGSGTVYVQARCRSCRGKGKLPA